MSNDHLDLTRVAERVRHACLRAAAEAYEDAGLRGLCAGGRWEYALDAIRSLPLELMLESKPPRPSEDS